MLSEGRKLILVVDDSADIRASLELLLPMFGFDVATAGNGLEALEYLHTHAAPGLILLDLRMPVMGGVQFRREQRHDPGLADIPVVVCSGEIDGAGTAGLEEIRAFCTKGADSMSLIRVVQQHCR
jgi:CheY-like chemotaxis protein